MRAQAIIANAICRWLLSLIVDEAFEGGAAQGAQIGSLALTL